MISIEIILNRPQFNLAVDVRFDDGITAIFGPSGAGKSTLLNCISGVIRPDKGLIKIGERTVLDTSQSVWIAPEKRRVAMVYQQGALFPHLDVQKNIEFGYRLLPESERRLNPIVLADFLGISHLMNRSIKDLSGGERQRIAIARALAMSPDLMLLDEPMASLDAQRSGSVLQYLKSVHVEFGTPMIYVSHSITEVVAISSSVLLIDEGRVIDFGPTSSLLGKTIPQDSLLVGNGSQKFDNILQGVVRDASDGSTFVQVGSVGISCGSQNRKCGENVVISIGANQIILATARPEQISARNIFHGRVTKIWSNDKMVFAETDVGTKLIAELTETARDELGINVGSDVFLVFKSTSVDVYDA